MQSLFLASVIFCVYTYAIYPFWLWFRVKYLGVSRRIVAARATHESPDSPDNKDTAVIADGTPKVSIVIAAHNEERHLPTKLASLASIDYPADKLQVVIISDGSTDATPELLRQSAVDYRHYEPAKGKPTALNTGVAIATGDIIVFMDARQSVSPNVVRSLVNRFDDPTVGVVSGELVLSDDGHREAANVGLYWRYEKWIRQNESELFSTTGATGALYAVRREDVVELAEDVLLDDFEIPIQVLRQGKRTVFESGAVAFDRAEEDAGDEFRRKVRTLTGNFQSFSRNRWLFDPFTNPVCWQFLSHKVFRLLVPVAMFVALIASLLGDGWFLNIAFVLQALFYISGVAALYFPAVAKYRILNFIKVFLQMNAAAVVGAWRYFFGSADVKWKASQ